MKQTPEGNSKVQAHQGVVKQSAAGNWLWIIPLVLASFFNLNALNNGFGWDDEKIIRNLGSSFSWSSSFYPNPNHPVGKTEGSYFRPVVSISYHFDRLIWGRDPFGFHFSVWLGHALNSVLIFFLTRRFVFGDLNPPGAKSVPSDPPGFPPGSSAALPLMVSSVFAVHPIHSEAVAWIAGRNDVFCLTFALASLLLYASARAIQAEARTSARILSLILFLAAMGLFLLGLLTKEAAVGLALIFPLYDFLSKRPVEHSPGTNRSLLGMGGIGISSLIPSLLVGIYFAMRIMNITKPFGNRSSPDPQTVPEILQAMGAYGSFLKMMLFPYPHEPFIGEVSRSVPILLLAILGLGLTGWGLIHAIRNRRLVLGMGFAWMHLMLAPAILVAVYPIAATPLAERYTYGPSFGFIILLGWLILRGIDLLEAKKSFIPRIELLAGGLLLLIFLFGSESWKRNSAWKSPLDFWERAVQSSPRSGFPHRELGNQYARLNRIEEAHELYRQAKEIDQKSLGPDHPAVAASLLNDGLLYYGQEDLVTAEPLLIQALEIFEKRLDPTHLDIAVAATGLGGLFFAKKEYEKAEMVFRRALAVREASLAPNHPEVLASVSNLVASLTAQGKDEQAQPLIQRSSRIKAALEREEAAGPDEEILRLAREHYGKGEWDQAELLFEQVIESYREKYGGDHPKTAEVLNHLAGVYYSDRKYSKAKPLFEEVLEIREKVLGPDDASVGQSLNNLGILYFAQGRYQKAQEFFERSIEVREKVLGADHPDLATSLNSLAGLYYTQGRYREAEPIYERALAIREKALGPDHPSVAKLLDHFALLLIEINQEDRAAELRNRAREIKEAVPNEF